MYNFYFYFQSLQKQIYRLQDQINDEKSKNSNLFTQIKNLKNLKEIDHRTNLKNLNDALSEIRRLKNLNKDLTYVYIIFFINLYMNLYIIITHICG